jgi:hypothetical protein
METCSLPQKKKTKKLSGLKRCPWVTGKFLSFDTVDSEAYPTGCKSFEELQRWFVVKED